MNRFVGISNMKKGRRNYVFNGNIPKLKVKNNIFT